MVLNNGTLSVLTNCLKSLHFSYMEGKAWFKFTIIEAYTIVPQSIEELSLTGGIDRIWPMSPCTSAIECWKDLWYVLCMCFMSGMSVFNILNQSLSLNKSHECRLCMYFGKCVLTWWKDKCNSAWWLYTLELYLES